MSRTATFIFVIVTWIVTGFVIAFVNAPGSPTTPGGGDSSGGEPEPPDSPAQIYNVQIFVDSGSEPVEVYDGQDSSGELLATVTYAGGPETVQCQSAYLYMTSSADTLNSETINVTSNISIDYELNYGDEGYGEAWEALFSVEGDGTIQGLLIEEYVAGPQIYTVSFTLTVDNGIMQPSGYVNIYDGQDATGRLIANVYETGPLAENDHEFTFEIESGYIYVMATGGTSIVGWTAIVDGNAEILDTNDFPATGLIKIDSDCEIQFEVDED